MNVLIVHLISNGDILYATPISKQIKEIDFPDCHLTWAVASKFKWVLQNNPYIDRIWEVDIENKLDGAGFAWKKTKEEALELKKSGYFDEVFFTQIGPDNWHNYNGMIRSSILKNYPFKISVPIDPLLYLTNEEVQNVTSFATKYNLKNYNKVIIFECYPQSFQSFINPEKALLISDRIAKKMKEVCFILSSHVKIDSKLSNIIDGSVLSLRENAELTKHAHLLIGCSSGITWITTSTWAKKIEMIQLLNTTKFFASVEYDFKYWGKATNRIIEITNENIDYIVCCIESVLKGSFDYAKMKYGEKLTPFYSYKIQEKLFLILKNRGLSIFIKNFIYNIRSNGFRIQTMKIYIKILLKYILNI